MARISATMSRVNIFKTFLTMVSEAHVSREPVSFF
jgi:hypothetical protein